jgi:uncharacterized membrane protein YeaQ/YmgE (transglycosylase-associated protein family)
MGIITTLIVGLIVGLIARFLMPGRDPMGFVLTALLGIIGAWLGSWAGQAMGLYSQGESAGYLMAVVGAMVVLFIYRMIVGRNRPALR